MLASVIIPVYRNWHGLSACLDGLSLQHSSVKEFEIVIVNNDPADSLPPWLRLPPNAVYVEEAAKGSYAARNAGIAVSRSPIICFTDSDCVPSQQWLRVVLDAFDSNDDHCRVGGPVRQMRPSGSNAVEHYDFLFSFSQEQEFFEHGWAPTANMCARRRVFDEIGLFDQSIYSGGDAEWGVRAFRKGWPIAFLDDAIVHHRLRSTLSEILTRERRLVAGQLTTRIRKRGWRRILVSSLIVTPLRLLPSFRTARRVIQLDELSVSLKLKLFFLMYIVRVVRQLEVVRIVAFGGKPERR